MSELRAGSPKREAMLRSKMLEALHWAGVDPDTPGAKSFAEAFVRMSRPPGAAPSTGDLFANLPELGTP